MSLAPIRLGANHGYCIEGDFVQLNAELSAPPATDDHALRLVVGEQIVLAELPIAGGNCFIQGQAFLAPPAGDGPWWPVLQLVAGGQVVDQAAYPAPVDFIQPRLGAAVNVKFGEKSAEITVDRIENPRPADNCSGTLALEIWSLGAPYTGGSWQGKPVAGQVLGCLNGQHAWSELQYMLPTGDVPADGHLVLMLREWTPAGYLTRDFRALARPEAVTQPEREAPKQAAAKSTEKATAKAPGAGKKPAAPAAAASLVAVNSASAAEIAAVKGISATLAKAIVAARPYATLDDLVRAKGVGVKLLARIRAHLTL